MSAEIRADYVIVGAGSAGCALAYRLSEDGRHSVIVIERGGTDAGPFIQMPGALAYPMGMPFYDWGLVSEPEPGLGHRRVAVPRGKVIGGSSSINGMVYVRGHALDFDTWETMGAAGWGFRDVLPYFKRMETSHGGEAGWRGTGGPLHVTRGRLENPLHRAFIEAGREAGYGVTADYNGARQEGFGVMERTIWRGRRWSAANAYLRPALRRPNVRLLSRAEARRVVFEGRRAVGVEISRRGRIETIHAGREVIVAASAVNSPKLLMLSGVGDAAALRRLGVPVIHDLPGVGRNLQDHLEVYVQFAARQAITLHRYFNPISKAWIGLRWLLFKTGPGASNHFEACGFVRSRAGLRHPDIQFHFLPAAMRYDGKAVADGHGFQVHVGPMRSKSRGTVTLQTADPAAAPAIRFNYMSAPHDWEEFRASIRLTREIVAQPAFAPFVAGEIAPGVEVTSDADIDDFVRQHAESAYHPCGTCRMGAPDDPGSVLDPECRVIGVERLRVVDSSIFPLITNGNLNAPSIMVGEKAADMILGRPPLPAIDRRPWIHPEWQTVQR